MRKKRAYILLALLALLLLSSQCREAAELGSSCYDPMRCDRCVSQEHSKRADTGVSALFVWCVGPRRQMKNFLCRERRRGLHAAMTSSIAPSTTQTASG